MLRRWGPRQCEATCVLRTLLFQQRCRTKPQSHRPKTQLLRNNSAARQSIQKLDQKISRAGRWCWAKESWTSASVVSQRRSYGHCLCDSFLHSSWDGGRCPTPDGHCLNILLFWRRSTAALVFRVGACFEVSLFCPLFPHSFPSFCSSRLRGR